MATESTAEQTLKASDVRYFWIEGGGWSEDRTYHYCRDCAWVVVALWHGGRLVTSDAPPPTAADTAWLWRELADLKLQPDWQPGPVRRPGVVMVPNAETEANRWLCSGCNVHFPRPIAIPRPADMEPCAQCGCSREIHSSCRGLFDTGCGMA